MPCCNCCCCGQCVIDCGQPFIPHNQPWTANILFQLLPSCLLCSSCSPWDVEPVSHVELLVHVLHCYKYIGLCDFHRQTIRSGYQRLYYSRKYKLNLNKSLLLSFLLYRLLLVEVNFSLPFVPYYFATESFITELGRDTTHSGVTLLFTLVSHSQYCSFPQQT